MIKTTPPAEQRTIFICAPANSYTGGPTLAHQLCWKLRKFGYNAVMYYYIARDGVCPVHENYLKYELPYTVKLDDRAENIVVTPETNVNLLFKVKRAKKVIWWMSVDFYFVYLQNLELSRSRIRRLLGLKARRYDILRKDLLHFAQCRYITDFLKEQGIDTDRIFYLSDYLDRDFINNSQSDAVRNDAVLYNPKKGFEFTEQLIAKAPDINWTPLINLTPAQMAEYLRSSKVYIDFGNHPGKDRIPREAAISGCCVITGRRGSARFSEDVFIPEEFKFEDKNENLDAIISLIRNMLADYPAYAGRFDAYRERIKGEEQQFDYDVKKIFSVL